MSIQEQIEDKIKQTFSVHFMQLDNESHMHSVPANSETHFKLVLVSADFMHMSKVKRHQKVYQLLADELAAEVHALALHLYTLTEWSEEHNNVPNSPNCLGGSKAK